jgi:hypothetical protein
MSLGTEGGSELGVVERVKMHGHKRDFVKFNL